MFTRLREKSWRGNLLWIASHLLAMTILAVSWLKAGALRFFKTLRRAGALRDA